MKTNTTNQPQFTYTALHTTTGKPTTQELARTIGCTTRTIQRWKAANQIPPERADHIAIALGQHPANIWPDQW